jgi:hypothetical protein
MIREPILYLILYITGERNEDHVSIIVFGYVEIETLGNKSGSTIWGVRRKELKIEIIRLFQ